MSVLEHALQVSIRFVVVIRRYALYEQQFSHPVSRINFKLWCFSFYYSVSPTNLKLRYPPSNYLVTPINLKL